MPLIESPKYLRIAAKSPRWASTPTRSPNSPRDLDEEGRLLPRQVEITKCSAHHRRAGSKHAQIVEVPAVRDEVATRNIAAAATTIPQIVALTGRAATSGLRPTSSSPKMTVAPTLNSRNQPGQGARSRQEIRTSG